jgi:hypothetical protein
LKEIIFILFYNVPITNKIEGTDKNISNDVHFQINIQEMVDLIFQKRIIKILHLRNLKRRMERKKKRWEKNQLSLITKVMMMQN